MTEPQEPSVEPALWLIAVTLALAVLGAANGLYKTDGMPKTKIEIPMAY